MFHLLLDFFFSLLINIFDSRKLNIVIVVQFSDGCMDAVILRDCTKAGLLALLLKMSDGSYVKSPYVTYLKVSFYFLSSTDIRIATYNETSIRLTKPY